MACGQRKQADLRCVCSVRDMDEIVFPLPVKLIVSLWWSGVPLRNKRTSAGKKLPNQRRAMVICIQLKTAVD